MFGRIHPSPSVGPPWLGTFCFGRLLIIDLISLIDIGLFRLSVGLPFVCLLLEFQYLLINLQKIHISFQQLVYSGPLEALIFIPAELNWQLINSKFSCVHSLEILTLKYNGPHQPSGPILQFPDEEQRCRGQAKGKNRRKVIFDEYYKESNCHLLTQQIFFGNITCQVLCQMPGIESALPELIRLWT